MARYGSLASLTLAVLGAALPFACNDNTVTTAALPGRDSGIPSDGSRILSDGAALPGASVGDACSPPTAPCRVGLVCTNGKCDWSHSGAVDSPCAAAGECQVNLQCVLGTCRTPNATAGGDGASCASDLDCLGGFRCAIVGLGAQCVVSGTGDVGQSCTTSTDCYAGLVCAPSQTDSGGPTCQPIPPVGGSGFGIPVAPNLTCDAPTTDSVTAYFEIPGAQGSAANADFFRLPFPNDARIKNGKVDLTGFPTPGSFLLGYDPVRIYVDALTANETGWGAYSTILFRFSGPIDFSTFTGGTTPPVALLDITDPAAPLNAGLGWGYSSPGGLYICHDWFAVRRPPGTPFEPGHTYVAYLTTAGRDSKGRAIARSPQFTMMLASSAPADPGLAGAYASYKPFRDYLLAQSISPSTILNATVFTTSDFRAPMEALASTVISGTVPTASSWVKCGTGVASPCPQADGDRACGGASSDYDEYHALVTLPIFQQGIEPYLASGGDTLPLLPRSENVCMAITVPKGTPPANGWPLVVYAHGTGGSFREHVRPEVAGVLAKATTPMAVLGYDQVEHGPRRGTSTLSPIILFQNFRNPAALRGNMLQSAADVVSMGRFAKTLTIPAAVTGTSDIKVDPTAIAFFGHDQGSTAGSVGLPYTDDYSAAVLSGNGASLMDALLTKTQPVNLAVGFPFAIGGDYDAQKHLFGGIDHPVLTLMQQWIDPGDPLNYGSKIARIPNSGIRSKSVFQTYGLGDTYSPPATMATYALAAGLDLAAHDTSVANAQTLADGGVLVHSDPIGSLVEQPVPLSGNFTSTTGIVTLAVREYQNSAGDGHFVVFEVPGANQDAVRFLAGAVSGQTPVVGQ